MILDDDGTAAALRGHEIVYGHAFTHPQVRHIASLKEGRMASPVAFVRQREMVARAKSCSSTCFDSAGDLVLQLLDAKGDLSSKIRSRAFE